VRPLLPTSTAAAIALACSTAPASTQQDPVAAFRALPAANQDAVLRAVAARLQQDADPGLARIRELAARELGVGVHAPAPLPPRTWFEPREFAPVAPARVVCAEGSPAWRRVRQQFPPPKAPAELHAAFVYDWREGRIAALPPPRAESRFAALLAGCAPGADAAVAALLLLFDRDDEQRRVGAWFEQLYADRDGHVFEGITLYEAWYSGAVVEVPDVDAIAFARRVLRTQSFVSPIPDGRRRERLYRQIRDAFGRYREYRTLREVAATTFVLASPGVDPVYQPLIDRLHFLWARTGFDPERVAQKLNAGDRSELLLVIDDALAAGSEAAALRDQASALLATTASLVRAAALDELRKAGGK
jgi:hypothetical protein